MRPVKTYNKIPKGSLADRQRKKIKGQLANPGAVGK